MSLHRRKKKRNHSPPAVFRANGSLVSPDDPDYPFTNGSSCSEYSDSSDDVYESDDSGPLLASTFSEDEPSELSSSAHLSNPHPSPSIAQIDYRGQPSTSPSSPHASMQGETMETAPNDGAALLQNPGVLENAYALELSSRRRNPGLSHTQSSALSSKANSHHDLLSKLDAEGFYEIHSSLASEHVDGSNMNISSASSSFHPLRSSTVIDGDLSFPVAGPSRPRRHLLPPVAGPSHPGPQPTLPSPRVSADQLLESPSAKLLSSYTCPICMSPPINATTTLCGHVACGACLFYAVRADLQRRPAFGSTGPPLPRCPVCRAVLKGWDGKGGGVIGLKPQVVIVV